VRVSVASGLLAVLVVSTPAMAASSERRFHALHAYGCTDQGCVDVDLTQLNGGQHPTFEARIRAYGYRWDKDIWVDGQIYRAGGELFWDFHEKQCTASERRGNGDTCEHDQIFQCDPGTYTIKGFSWIAGDNTIADAEDSITVPI
jgi:hypothetical protein